MKYIVTGGAGFIGSHIAEELVKQKEDVTIIDNLSSGKLENIKEFKNKIKLVEGDIRNINLLKKEFKDADFVLHQAALKSVPGSFNNPEEYHDVNINGTLNVLKAAKECNVKRVIFASSGAVYGPCKVFPQKEDFYPKPTSPYGLTKLVGEHYCKIFNDSLGIETVSLRYFNVFGPRQDPESEYANVIPKFIALVNSGNQPTIFSDGEQTRDFIYVKEVAEANIKACKENVSGEIINIASGASITINQLLKKINNILGKDIKAEYGKPRKGDVKHSLADISKQRELLKIKPNDFDTNLMEMINWFKNVEKIFIKVRDN